MAALPDLPLRRPSHGVMIVALVLVVLCGLIFTSTFLDTVQTRRPVVADVRSEKVKKDGVAMYEMLKDEDADAVLKDEDADAVLKDGDAGAVLNDEDADTGCPPSKRILVWTTFWRLQHSWWERIFYRQVSRQCLESRCELVYDHQLLDTADAVLFHPVDMKPSYTLPPTHPPRQPWIFFSLESPSLVVEETGIDLARLGGVFNWTMTYRRDSDVVVPYGVVLPRVTSPGPAKDYWAGKSSQNMAVWAVSHCKTRSRRESFVKELVKYIPVDIFGKCGTKTCGNRLVVKNVGTFNQTECTKEMEKYMFYLAFENSICLDYITEKFYQALTLEVVPVVLGGGPYKDIAPPNSYVDALDFPSPKHLAGYLKKVASDHDAYNKFFAWKQHYTVELGFPFPTLVCDLCAKLHDPASLAPPTKPAQNIRNYTEHTGLVGAVEGRDENGSYPDIKAWFLGGSGCRRWWLDSKKQHR